ncbi:MAG: hypothetical protein AB7P14_05095 [Blastocatellales bacterium]
MDQKRYFVTMTVLSGFLLTLVIWLSTSVIGQKNWVPFSVFFFLLGGSLSIWGAIWMWLWNPAAFSGNAYIPKRSFILFALGAVLSAFYLFYEWPYGLRYQGRTFTIRVVMLNVVFLLALLSLGIWAQKSPSFKKNLGFHWLLFTWMLAYAFPLLGEPL